MKASRNLSEKFPSPPLREVAFEIRFPALLRIENEIYRFQDEIRDDFPVVAKSFSGPVPSSEGLMVPMASVWEFNNEDLQLRLRVKTNSLGLISTKYKSFDVFQPAIKDCIEKFLATYEIPYVNRIGLRYIDDYVFKGDPHEEYGRFFVPTFNKDKIALEDVINHRTEIRRRVGVGFLTLRAAFMQVEDAYHYVLDTDSYFENAHVEATKIIEVLDELHQSALSEFHAYVTDDFVEYLRKEG